MIGILVSPDNHYRHLVKYVNQSYKQVDGCFLLQWKIVHWTL